LASHLPALLYVIIIIINLTKGQNNLKTKKKEKERGLVSVLNSTVGNKSAEPSFLLMSLGKSLSEKHFSL
jgi:hypothetical protein